MTEIERVLRVLEAAGVRYLVVGGVAVVLHGPPRFTADLDLAVALEPSNVRAALAALATLGYRPRVPVSVETFADRGERQRLVQERMTVLSFSGPELPMTEVDVFADPPFAFEETYRRADRVELGEVSVHVASIRDVIAMKRSGADPERNPSLAGWSAHEAEQRKAWQRTTARQRLAWLEDAKRFAGKAKAAALRRSERSGEP